MAPIFEHYYLAGDFKEFKKCICWHAIIVVSDYNILLLLVQGTSKFAIHESGDTAKCTPSHNSKMTEVGSNSPPIWATVLEEKFAKQQKVIVILLFTGSNKGVIVMKLVLYLVNSMNMQ